MPSLGEHTVFTYMNQGTQKRTADRFDNQLEVMDLKRMDRNIRQANNLVEICAAFVQ